ncbi:MAG: SACE_7040 family transcriptional regulator [Mycobacteriaceae bacterium]|jgi:AcrR family transcriptional regulator
MTTPRREQLLDVAAGLMAERGFHGVSINDLGAAAGVSGPAVYRHFSSKQAILGEMLIGISQRLLDTGRQRVAAASSPAEAVTALIAWHVEFALSEPNLIRVQDRDLASTSPEDRKRVRQLQRAYAEVWVQQLLGVLPELGEAVARARVHAVFGLLNSTPYSGRGLAPEQMAALLRGLGSAALLAPNSD